MATGASGSGKSTFTHRLKAMLANIAVISLDMYNDGSKVVEDNFDDPRICDFDTLMQNVEDLRAGRPTQVPIYDFKQSQRVGYQELEVPASRIIVLEGIHALSTRLEHLLDLRIAITGGVHLDLVKRVRCLTLRPAHFTVLSRSAPACSPHACVELYRFMSQFESYDVGSGAWCVCLDAAPAATRSWSCAPQRLDYRSTTSMQRALRACSPV